METIRQRHVSLPVYTCQGVTFILPMRCSTLARLRQVVLILPIISCQRGKADCGHTREAGANLTLPFRQHSVICAEAVLKRLKKKWQI